jgi:hypothetical protein
MRHAIAAVILTPAILSPAFPTEPLSPPGRSATIVPQTAAALRRVLDVGFAAGRNKVAAAQREWQKIPAADRRDPRVDYAWGLVLHKHHRTRDALRQYESAAGMAQPAYRPALQSAIWMKLARKQYAPGLKSLRELIANVADEKRSGGDEATRVQSAEWTGRVVAALQAIPLPDRTKTDVDRLDVQAEKVFHEPAVAAAYHKGKQAVKTLAGDLSVEAVKTRIQAGKKLAKKVKQGRKQIASRKDDVDKSQESLKLTAEQWKDWLEEQQKQTKRSLTRATKELAILETRRASISRSYLLAVRQRTLLLASMRLGQPGAERTSAVTPNANDIALGQIQQTLASYELQHQGTVQQMNLTRQAAATAVQRYRAAVQRYQTATGKIAKSNTELARLESQLKQQERKLRKSSVKQTAAVRQMKQRRASFTTYVPFDVDAEKKSLLESLKN